MRVYKLPPRVTAFLFDIDGTLYTNAAYMRSQNEVLIQAFAEHFGMEYKDAAAKIDTEKTVYQAKHAGAAPSLGLIMTRLGVDMRLSVEWRTAHIKPELFLSPDATLQKTLGSLRGKIIAVTNNPRSVGEAALTALGVLSFFDAVVGLDDTMQSKPAPAPYIKAAERAGAPSPECVSIGDRYDIDIAPALALGMGGILVAGIADVYALPNIFKPA